MRFKLQNFIDYSLPALFLIMQLGCSGARPKENQAEDSFESNTLQKKKPGSSYSDTIKINSATAVFYFPDSIQLEKLKAITDRMTYEGTMHDCLYQMRNSRDVLKRSYKNVQIMEVTNARYLVFKKLTGAKEYLDLDTQSNPCGLFILDGTKSHRLVDMTNIETELGFYFKDGAKDQ